MATYVLCHGGWTGGWQWREVATLLRHEGHTVFTPTFTGSGERSHLASPDIDLNTYIQDIVMVLKYEDLHDVILVGYSLSGLAITGAAEQAAERLSHLVYVDAYVLRDGESLADQLGPQIMAGLEQQAEQYGEGWRLPHDPPDADRRTDQPVGPVYTRLSLENPDAAGLPRTFIYCTEGAQDIGPLHGPIDEAAERAERSDDWRYRELDTGHMPMWTEPEKLVDLLLEVA
jgi:pimeloyl-ACP methyl ester carboxylesterase